MKKRFLCLILTAITLFSAASCDILLPVQPNTDESTSVSDQASESESVELPAVYAEIADPTVYLFTGDTYELSYTLNLPDKTAADVEWMSSTDCATVENGIVTAHKEGYAVISGGGESSCLVQILSTKMPVLSVDTGGASIESKEAYHSCTISLQSENEAFSFSNISAGIRVRGNSTSSKPKKPYRIKFNDKRNLLGMNEGAECKSWVLLAEWYDDSMIRNTTAQSLGAMILEEYNSDWRYVSLNVNGQFQGVYVLCEQSQINKNRIDIEEAGADTADVLSGYLFELDGSKPHDGKIVINYGDYDITTFEGNTYKRGSGTHYYAIKNDGLSASQKLFASTYLTSVMELMYQATCKNKYYEFDEDYVLVPSDSTSAEEVISAAIDVDSLARMYILSEIIYNCDEHWKSFYLYVDMSENGTGLLTFGCPWDFDGAIVDWNTYNYQPTDQYFAAVKSNIWYTLAMNHEWFRERVKELWQELYADSDGFSQVWGMISRISEVYAEEFERDAQLWSRKEDQQYHAHLTVGWLKQRINWLNGQFGETQ